MPVYTGKHLGSKKECLVKLRETTSIEEAKEAICVQLGLESSNHHVLYRDQVLNDRSTLEDLDTPPSGADHVVLFVCSKEATPDPASKLASDLGGVFLCTPTGGRGDVGQSKRNKSKFSDPRKWSLSENSSVISRVEQVTCRAFNAEDSAKIATSLATKIQRIVDSLSYDELEYLATDCLKKKQIKMERLRDDYYNSFQVQNS